MLGFYSECLRTRASGWGFIFFVSLAIGHGVTDATRRLRGGKKGTGTTCLRQNVASPPFSCGVVFVERGLAIDICGVLVFFESCD